MRPLFLRDEKISCSHLRGIMENAFHYERLGEMFKLLAMLHNGKHIVCIDHRWAFIWMKFTASEVKWGKNYIYSRFLRLFSRGCSIFYEEFVPLNDFHGFCGEFWMESSHKELFIDVWFFCTQHKLPISPMLWAEHDLREWKSTFIWLSSCFVHAWQFYTAVVFFLFFSQFGWDFLRWFYRWYLGMTYDLYCKTRYEIFATTINFKFARGWPMWKIYFIFYHFEKSA